jgi:hypothetical protein
MHMQKGITPNKKHHAQNTPCTKNTMHKKHHAQKTPCLRLKLSSQNGSLNHIFCLWPIVLCQVAAARAISIVDEPEGPRKDYAMTSLDAPKAFKCLRVQT